MWLFEFSGTLLECLPLALFHDSLGAQWHFGGSAFGRVVKGKGRRWVGLVDSTAS